MARTRTSTVVKSRYVRPGSSRTMPAAYRGRAGGGARRQIGTALRYIETRTLGAGEQPEERAIFSAHEVQVTRRAAREDLAHGVTAGVAYHSLVLSPGPRGDGMDAAQMRAWTRNVMADLVTRWGSAVTWYAVVHQHTGHIHAHVIVAASREHADGTRRWTRFNRADFAAMRQSGDRWADHERVTAYLLREAEQYAADLVQLALALPRGGDSDGRGANDRDDVERTVRSRR